jgi:hypothetical protein
MSMSVIVGDTVPSAAAPKSSGSGIGRMRNAGACSPAIMQIAADTRLLFSNPKAVTNSFFLDAVDRGLACCDHCPQQDFSPRYFPWLGCAP